VAAVFKLNPMIFFNIFIAIYAAFFLVIVIQSLKGNDEQDQHDQTHGDSNET